MKALTAILSAILISACASAPEMPSDVAEVGEILRAEFGYPPRRYGDQITNIQAPIGDCEPYARLARDLLRERGHSANIVLDRSDPVVLHAYTRAVVDGVVWHFDIESRYPIRGPSLPRFDDVPMEF